MVHKIFDQCSIDVCINVCALKPGTRNRYGSQQRVWLPKHWGMLLLCLSVQFLNSLFYRFQLHFEMIPVNFPLDF